MKKKTRRIVVDNRNYTYMVSEDCWPKNILKVWKEQDKNKILLQIEVDASEPITPSKVAAIIRAKDR